MQNVDKLQLTVLKVKQFSYKHYMAFFYEVDLKKKCIIHNN